MSFNSGCLISHYNYYILTNTYYLNSYCLCISINQIHFWYQTVLTIEDNNILDKLTRANANSNTICHTMYAIEEQKSAGKDLGRGVEPWSKQTFPLYYIRLK